jgi:hypothetical protein
MLQFSLNCRDVIKSWWVCEKLFRTRRIGTYPTNLLRTPYRNVVSLLSRLYGEEDSTKFKESWLPFIYAVTKTSIMFNWEYVGEKSSLLHWYKLCWHRNTTLRMHLTFYMASYLLNIICIINSFLGMGWQWKSNHLPIHIYCNNLWEPKYWIRYPNTCEQIIISLY